MADVAGMQTGPDRSADIIRYQAALLQRPPGVIDAVVARHIVDRICTIGPWVARKGDHVLILPGRDPEAS